jgi:hypothetical protein
MILPAGPAGTEANHDGTRRRGNENSSPAIRLMAITMWRRPKRRKIATNRPEIRPEVGLKLQHACPRREGRPALVYDNGTLRSEQCGAVRPGPSIDRRRSRTIATSLSSILMRGGSAVIQIVRRCLCRASRWQHRTRRSPRHACAAVRRSSPGSGGPSAIPGRGGRR